MNVIHSFRRNKEKKERNESGGICEHKAIREVSIAPVIPALDVESNVAFSSLPSPTHTSIISI